MHPPPAQPTTWCAPATHARPQAPQFDGSLARMVQRPHETCPGGQAVHTPAVQASVTRHALPHRPQWNGSSPRRTHASLPHWAQASSGTSPGAIGASAPVSPRSSSAPASAASVAASGRSVMVGGVSVTGARSGATHAPRRQVSPASQRCSTQSPESVIWR